MFPYVAWHVITIGPLTIQVWGLFVALGIAAACMVGAREAERWGIDRARLLDAAGWAILGGLLGARAAHVLLYEPQAYLADPMAVLRVWEGGMSMLGAIVGGAAGLALFAARTRVDVWAYANLMAFVLPLGCGIGRIGCFFIHDHPGTLRDGGFLTVRYPDGDRYDHGLLLSMVGFALFALFLYVRRRTAGAFRAYLPLFLMLDGAARFALDFLRATDLPGADTRYLGLTPMQYGALAFIALGAWMLYTDPLWNKPLNNAATQE